MDAVDLKIIPFERDYMDGNMQHRPKEYGTYLVIRKDGKCHKEVWNTTGWAYNHNTITHFTYLN